jgi:hypothetical protein
MIAVARKYDQKYDLHVERITITIPKRTLTAIKRVAGPRGVSKFLVDAAERALGYEALLELLDELDEKYGRSTPEQREKIWADMRRISGLDE